MEKISVRRLANLALALLLGASMACQKKVRNSWRGLPRSLASRTRLTSFPAGAADLWPSHASSR